MRILLVNPPCDPRTIGLRNMAKIEPLGLETIGAAVRGEHEVRLVDMEVAPEDLQRELDVYAPDVVGVTSEIVHVTTALRVLRDVRARYPSCLTVVGGHHATMRPEDFSSPWVDMIVVGEGTWSFRELCAARAAGASTFDTIPGLAIPDGAGRVRRTPPRDLPADLDAYPLPDRSLTARYRSRYYYLHEPSVAAVRTSFGCTHHCTFCSVRVYAQGGYCARSPEKVVEEIAGLEEDFVLFCDDHSFLDPERMRRLGELLLEAGVKKRYFAYARADSIVAHRDVFALWARVGLTIVMTGLEAVDAEALRRSGKRTSADTNEEAVRIAGELGFFISAGFLVEPHFQREDFERIDRYAAARPSILIVEYTALTPFPGTPLHRKERGSLLTQEPAFYDLQHFVLPTLLPTRELYKLMLEFHVRMGRRMFLRVLRERPGVFVSPHMARYLPGLIANARSYREAHLHAPDRRPDTPTDPDAPPGDPAVSLTYDGWSGWRATATDRELPPVLFDPAPGTAWPTRRAVVCLTHGHPEHVGEAVAQLARADRAPLAVVASKGLCAWLERHAALRPGDLLRAAVPGDRVTVEGWTFDVFAWEHMPLVPPEPRQAVQHLGHLLAHPVRLGRVVADGLLGAPHGPMLGFVLPSAQGRVVVYGEGLHRRVRPEDLRAVLGEDGDATLVAGLEPEDVDALPGLVAQARPRELLLFEPHGPWRASFGMHQVDAPAVHDAFRQAGVDLRLVRPGDTVHPAP